MKITQKYSHLNGEEYLIVHHKGLYKEIKEVVKNINAEDFKTKVSSEKTKMGNMLYNPIELNKVFEEKFSQKKLERESL